MFTRGRAREALFSFVFSEVWLDQLVFYIVSSLVIHILRDQQKSNMQNHIGYQASENEEQYERENMECDIIIIIGLSNRCSVI